MKNYCLNHPDKEATSFCSNCNDYYCIDCLNEGKEYYFCNKQECVQKYQQEGSPVNSSLQHHSKYKSIKMILVILFIVIIFVLGFLNFSTIKRYFFPPDPYIVHTQGAKDIFATIRNYGGEGYIIIEANIICGSNNWTQSVKRYFYADELKFITIPVDSTRTVFSIICNYKLKAFPYTE